MRNLTRILLILMVICFFLISFKGKTTKGEAKAEFLIDSVKNIGIVNLFSNSSSVLFDINNSLEKRADSIIINDYSEVVMLDVCTNLLQLNSPQPFKAGDTVLLIQMKGAMIDSTNTASFGNLLDYGQAGNYEFNYIKSVNGNIVELLNTTIRQYDVVNGAVQLVRVPYFQNYQVSEVLTCLPWNGRVGGVLVFNVANTLSLNANIDVSEKGFRGGNAVRHPLIRCHESSFFYRVYDGSLAAYKGEGIFQTSTLTVGRGKLVNGGGGGNNSNSGGAGGANGGDGGKGGDQYINCGSGVVVNGGVPGISLSYSNQENRIFLGGGGGAGQMNDTPALSGGGNGGGIVLINANTIVPNGFEIISNGGTPPHLRGSNDDGRSGGGAGGTILLNAPNIGAGIIARANGGNGDYATPPQGDIHGPGGGGGGGVIWSSIPINDPSATLQVAPGSNGVNSNINNNPYGAMPGLVGVVLSGFTPTITSTAHVTNIESVNLNTQFISCDTYQFQGTAQTNQYPIVNWFWDFGDGSTANTQSATHQFSTLGIYDVKLVVTDANGCKDSATVSLNPQAGNFNFTYAMDICDPFNFTFTGTGVTGNAYWDLGDGTIMTGVNTFTHRFAPGDYTIKYIVGNSNCFDTLYSSINVGLIQDDIIVTNDTIICLDTPAPLQAVSASRYCWSPAQYLNGATLQNPIATNTQIQQYTLTAEVIGANLVQNGDFSQGNTAFQSTYSFNSSNGFAEGTYNVGNNVSAWHNGLANCQDHTGNNGNMMMLNGSPVLDQIVWQQTISVQPNTNYVFSAWLQSLHSSNPARLRFTINGRVMGEGLLASTSTCMWQQFFANWNPGNATTATIAIVNTNTGTAGNDFALDDIVFAPLQMKRESVIVDVNIPQVTAVVPSDICVRTPIQLLASGAVSYQWDNANLLNNATIANPIAIVSDTTTFIVKGINSQGCEAADTITVNTFPVVSTSILSDTSICRSSTLQLWASGAQTYSWTPDATLQNAQSASPLASPLQDTRYFVEMFDANNCRYEDSVMIAIRPDAVFTATASARICENDSIQLTAGGGDVYAWTPALNIDDPSISNPTVWPATSTQFQVSIIDTVCFQSGLLVVPVEVSPLPVISASRSNDLDCQVNQSQLLATGGVRYRWSPSETLDNANVRNPVARPRQHTTYTVTGESSDGCFNQDSVLVRVDKVNEGDYLMPNAFTPNGDGLNDCYGIKLWGAVEAIEFSIFNRWGERIFYTKDPNACWDGRIKGIPQDTGVFVYMIKAKTACADEVFRKGTFTLIR